MACKGTKHAKATAEATQATAATVQAEVKTTEVQAPVSRLLFGVHSIVRIWLGQHLDRSETQ